jgi:formylmethanofuran dehydrogenase subunit D
MIKVKIYIEHSFYFLDDEVCIEIELLTIPRKGDSIVLSTKQREQLEKAVELSPHKEGFIYMDDAKWVNTVFHIPGADYVAIELGN